MFDTIAEFKAAMGTFGGGLASVGIGLGTDFGCGVGGEGAGGFDAAGAGEGLEGFVGSFGWGADFADSSRTWLNIFDVSGGIDVLTVAFAGGGAAVAGSSFVGTGGGGGAALEGIAAFEIGLEAGDTFLGVVGVAFTAFEAVVIDFALLVAFLSSGISTSMGSVTTFFGLPLFLTTSEDIACERLRSAEPWLRDPRRVIMRTCVERLSDLARRQSGTRSLLCFL